MGMDFGGVFGVVCVFVSGTEAASGVELLVELERSELILPHTSDDPEDDDFGLGVNGIDLVFVFALERDEEVDRQERA